MLTDRAWYWLMLIDADWISNVQMLKSQEFLQSLSLPIDEINSKIVILILNRINLIGVMTHEMTIDAELIFSATGATSGRVEFLSAV